MHDKKPLVVAAKDGWAHFARFEILEGDGNEVDRFKEIPSP